jgi:hypothetical protein
VATTASMFLVAMIFLSGAEAGFASTPFATVAAG